MVRVEGFFADDVGDRHFAADLVRHAGDGGFGDFFLLEKKLFDLARIDIEAAGDDQVAAPALAACSSRRRSSPMSPVRK